MIGKGNTGIVMPLPGGDRIRKSPVPWYSAYLRAFQCEQLRREISVYQHLPRGHRRLIRLLDHHDAGEPSQDVFLVLEYMPHLSLRSYLQGGARFPNPDDEQRARGAAIPRNRRASWALEATDGVMLLHAHDVLHADLRPDNMLLDSQLHLRLIDFSGCSLRGAPALSYESASFYMPRTPANSNGDVGCSVTTDLFALGSSLYQIVTGDAPWGGETHDEIEAHFARGEFPPLAESGGQPILFSNTIGRCWHGQFAAAADVLSALQADIRAAFGPEDLAFIEQESGISLDVS